MLQEMQRILRVYADGSWAPQTNPNVNDHIGSRPGTALVVDGVVVYEGIGVTKDKIEKAIATYERNSRLS